jgi:hypothetical protein
MEELTKEQKLAVAIEAKKIYMKEERKMGLCQAFAEAFAKVCYKSVTQSGLVNHMPELYEFKPKGHDCRDFWWGFSESGMKARTRVLNKIIKNLS